MSLVPATRRLRSHRVTLPWDCLVLVLRECDEATLATLGRVSLDVLAVTVPILYQEIEIRTLSALELLFCSRSNAKTSPRIDSLLCMSATRVLSVNLSTSSARQAAVVKISLRAPHLGSLTLDVLRLSLSYDYTTRSSFHSVLHKRLFPLVNPKQVFHHGRDRPANSDLWTLVEARELLNAWTHLELLDVRGAIPHMWDPKDDHANWLFGLSRPPSGCKRVLRFHLASFPPDISWGDDEARTSIVGYFARVGSKNIVPDQPGSIVLVAPNAETKRKTEQAIQAVVREEWRSAFVVEVENEAV